MSRMSKTLKAKFGWLRPSATPAPAVTFGDVNTSFVPTPDRLSIVSFEDDAARTIEGGPLRLINFSTYKLVSFAHLTPPYAILSHTWGSQSDEIGLDDWRHGRGQGKPGYAKTICACEQAQSDGLNYLWVDTCCIDKTYSTELSESINSMYR